MMKKLLIIVIMLVFIFTCVMAFSSSDKHVENNKEKNYNTSFSSYKSNLNFTDTNTKHLM